jgi:hypothetical protein
MGGRTRKDKIGVGAGANIGLRRRRRRRRREREFWEHPTVAARTLEGAYYTLYGRLREVERKFFNYFKMSTSTFDYIVDRLALHLECQNTMMR